MTLEAWVYPDRVGGRVVAQRGDQGAGGGRGVQPVCQHRRERAGTCMSCGRRHRDQPLDARGTAALAAQHVDPSGRDLRRDDAAAVRQRQRRWGARAVASPLLTSTGVLRIGGNSMWGEYFAGRIDEVRLYNRALTAAEIQADMAAPIGT